MDIAHLKEDCSCVDLELELGRFTKRKRHFGFDQAGSVRCGKIGQLHPEMFKDNFHTVRGALKGKGEVFKQFARASSKAPNLTCRIESFGRICQKQLAYWLLTRVDPVSKILISPDGKEFSLSPNQVYWVLGIPNGGKTVPTKKNMTSELKYKVEAILNKYWQSWETGCNGYEGKVYTSKGISVNPRLMERLEGEWMEWEEVEFKTLFLLLSLHMVLCPTQSPKLSADLVPALTCAHDCMDYDWCGLVVSKLLGSVSSFARKFYANGYVGGSGGCLLFIVIMYLDRLNRVPLRWGVFRRIKVWNMKEIGSVSRLDRHSIDGDFGKMGMIDVVYGESHPKEARDSNGPSLIQPNEEVIPYIFKPPKARRIRCATNPCFVRNPLPDEYVLYMEVGEMICNVQQEEQTDCVDLVVGTPRIRATKDQGI